MRVVRGLQSCLLVRQVLPPLHGDQLTVRDDTRGFLGDSAVALVGHDAVGAALLVAEAAITVATASRPSALVALE